MYFGVFLFSRMLVMLQKEKHKPICDQNIILVASQLQTSKYKHKINDIKVPCDE